MKIFNLRISFGNILSQLKLKQKSKGVTLLELGVVLLVIGIVISGAYVAYDFFIKRARTTKTMIEMKDYRKGFESFHSVYGALPGDMTSASRRIDSTMIDGNGDGKIASETEQNAFWPHMSYSKMISKPSGGKYENVATNVSPKVGLNLPRLQDSDDIAIGVVYNTPSGVRANSFILGGLDGRAVTTPMFSVEEVQIMDQKFDDNNPTTGGVMCGMGVQSGTITACSYANASVQSDANVFIPFTPQTTDASNSCPAQSVQISQQLVANAPVIAANATVQYNCRDINPSYSGQYSLTCNPVKDSANNVISYSISTTSTSCSLKTCAVPTSISGAASIQSTAVQSGQYLSYTCNAGLYATQSLCSPNLSTDSASLNPSPACTASPTGVSGNIPIYAPDAQTFKDSGRSFNDAGSTIYDIFSGNKIFGLFGSTSTSQNYIPKYSTQNAGVVPSSIYDNGTSVGVGTATPNSSAILDLSSTTKAFLLPRMTTVQMNAIAAPAKGMIIFNTTDNTLYQYSGTTWGAVNGIVPVAGATPVGTIAAWSSTTAPNGWVLVDGQTVTSSSNYPELCQVLNGGTACASGVTKTVPDFRGYFLRGLDNTRMTDKNNVSGSTTMGATARMLLSIQTDDNKAHIHTNNTGTANGDNTLPQIASSGQNNTTSNTDSTAGELNIKDRFAPLIIASSGGAETRPKNIAVNYIMKAQSTNLTTQDVNNILSTMMSAVANSTANSLVMFDATASKFSSTNVYQRTTSGVTSVGVGTSSPAQSAVLELASTTQGFLPPRMTTAQMKAIATPATGMIVYTTDNGALQMWNGTSWAIITSPSTGPTASTVPTGTIVAWGSNTIPNGWLLLNGGTYSSQTYPDLANALGCGTSTCTLPNYQGYFLRGLGGVDPDSATRTIGSVQLDDFKSHTHTFVQQNGIQWSSNYMNTNTNAADEPTVTNNTGSAGGTETRPKNIAVNYIIKAKNVVLSQSDLTSITSNLLTTGTTGTPYTLSMFDSTGAKFQSSGLSQVSNVLSYNPTGSTNLMSLSSTGMLLNPTSGTALQIGNSYTGIGNPNYTGTNALSDKLQFYVNSLTTPVVSVNANGQVGIGSGASSPTLPLSIGDSYTGISASSSTDTNSSVLQFGVQTNAVTNSTTNIMSLSTLGLTLPSISTASTTGVTAGTIGYSGTSVYLYNGTAWSAIGAGGGGSSFWSTSTDTANNPSTANNAMSEGDISVSGLVVGDGSGTGTGNSAFGISALKTNSTGEKNTAIGLYALFSNTTGVSNTGLGARAGAPLNGIQSVSGSNNTFIGYNSEPETTSQSNTITMGDSNIAKFRIPGLSINALAKQLFLGVNPTTTSFSGFPAILIGDVGTGIVNAGAGLTSILDFYVNGSKQMSLNANGDLTVTNISTTTLSPATLTVGAGGLSTTTLSASGTSTLAGLSATSITNSGNLSVTGTSTLTGLLTANGGITTTDATINGTLSAATFAPSTINTGAISVTGTSTLTGLLTANGGIRFGTTTPISPQAGTVYYDTSTNSLQMYSTMNGAKWFRVLTRKDIIAFTIDQNGNYLTLSALSNVSLSPNPYLLGLLSTHSCDASTNGWIGINMSNLGYATKPVVSVTWDTQSSVGATKVPGDLFVQVQDTTRLFIVFSCVNSPINNIEPVKIHVTLINPN